MARMIPASIHRDITSNAEKHVFRLLRDAPDTKSWVVLHSLGLSRHQTKRRAEIDFVVLCDRGIFALEVKGGRISRQAGIWQTQDRYNEISRLSESPYDQASSAMFALEKDIRARFPRGHSLHQVIMGYGVMVPTTSEAALEFGTDGDRAITYCRQDARKSISHYIGRLGTFFEAKGLARRARPTKQDIEELTRFLRGDFDVIPPLWSKVKETSDELLALTEEQYLILDAMAAKPRLIIRGAAGTGKTELARREALTAASSGKRVLLLCYNRFLAAKLRADALLRQCGANLKISTIYQYMDELIRESEYAAEFNAKRLDSANKELYGRLYPEYASLAFLENDIDKWDLIVVDEGQDLATEEILDFLALALAGGLEAGNWRWFMDDNNQAGVYGVADLASVSRLEQFGASSVLTVNCRNTRQINDETRMLTTPTLNAVARIDGLPVRYVWYGDIAGEKKLLGKQLKRIIDAGVPPSDVVILSATAADKSVASKLSPGTARILDEAVLNRYENSELIPYTTISAYKGLEADVVLVTDINEIESEWAKSVLYVGMSRAKGELIIFLPDDLKGAYNQKLRTTLKNIDKKD